MKLEVKTLFAEYVLEFDHVDIQWIIPLSSSCLIQGLL